MRDLRPTYPKLRVQQVPDTEDYFVNGVRIRKSYCLYHRVSPEEVFVKRWFDMHNAYYRFVMDRFDKVE